jgi:hypothetical protein
MAYPYGGFLQVFIRFHAVILNLIQDLLANEIADRSPQ